MSCDLLRRHYQKRSGGISRRDEEFPFPSVDVVRPTGACKARRREELIS